jgi:hypothetical protein
MSDKYKKRNIIERLLNDYTPNQVVCYVKILGEKVPISREEALQIFGYKPKPWSKEIREAVERGPELEGNKQ